MLFGVQDAGEGIPDEEEEPTEGEIPDDGETPEASSLYSWLSLLYDVSQLTMLDFNQCWEMGIYEFFNYAAFCRERADRQKAINDRYIREMRAKYGRH